MQEKDKDLRLEDLVKEFEYGFITGKRDQPYKIIKKAMEKRLIEISLRKSFGNQMKAAKILGINRNTLMTKVKRLGIDVSRWKI
jgi:DNA-binding protein Fis